MSLTIHVLGPLVIESDGCRLDKLPRKARALLAFLAAQNGEPVSRERLADLLWPFQGSEQGRHSLRNCLLELRKALGRGAASDLAADFANCRIEDAIVDLADFERLSRSQDRGELQAATDLYRGDFLADFYIASEPFQEWLGAARDRALAAICGVLERLIALQDAAGDYEAAIQSGRRLVILEPLSEAGQRALMRAYARGGRRGEALRQYKSCANTLQRELSVTPDEETQALARSIARSGGEGIVSGTPSNQGRSSSNAIADRVAEGRSSRPQQQPTPGSEKPQWPCLLPSIAVAIAPMRNLTGDSDRQRLVEAFTDDLVTDLLRQGRGLSLKPLKSEQPKMAKLSRPPASEREYDYVVTGSAQCGNRDTLRVNMRIVDAATSEFVWAGRHQFRPEELAPIQTRITRRISRELHVLLLQAASSTRVFRRRHGARGQRIAVAGGERSATRHARGVVGGGTALVPNSAGERPAQCRGADRACHNLPTSCQQPVVGRAAGRGNRLRPGPRGRGNRALDRPGAHRRALRARHVVLGGRAIGGGGQRLRARSGDRFRPRYGARLRRVQCSLSRPRRGDCASKRACDEPRSIGSTAQHLALLRRLCRTPPRANRGLDFPSPQILGT